MAALPTRVLRRAAAIPAAALLLAAASPASAAVTSADQVNAWGGFFGAPKGGGGHTSPATFTFPAAVAEVGSSNSDEYVLLADGTLWARGDGTDGELGNGSQANSPNTFVQVTFPAGVSIASIPADAMPYNTGLAVDTAGNLWGWGLNKGGELCTGTVSMYTTPVKLTALAAPVTAVAGANEHLTAVADGMLESCGWDSDGVLGDGQPKGAARKPVPVVGLDSADVTAVYESFDNAGALTSSGAYYDWGENPAGQLGDGTLGGSSDVPVQVSLPGPVTQVSQGGSDPDNGQTAVMLAGGAMYDWGADSYGQLDNGTTAPQPSPIPLTAPGGITWTILASGGGTMYAIDSGGGVWAWGAGGSGQIGNGRTADEMSPVKVDTGAGMISATANNVIVAGSPSRLALSCCLLRPSRAGQPGRRAAPVKSAPVSHGSPETPDRHRCIGMSPRVNDARSSKLVLRRALVLSPCAQRSAMMAPWTLRRSRAVPATSAVMARSPICCWPRASSAPSACASRGWNASRAASKRCTVT